MSDCEFDAEDPPIGVDPESEYATVLARIEALNGILSSKQVLKDRSQGKSEIFRILWIRCRTIARRLRTACRRPSTRVVSETMTRLARRPERTPGGQR